MTRKVRMPWPLLAVLAVQAALSASMVRTRTAFGDEALYLSAGHLEWSHWLHGTQIPAYQTWFSGAPVIYPPVGAIADSLGGLAAARLLSLVFMLGVTSFVWSTTSPAARGRARRLLRRRAVRRARADAAPGLVRDLRRSGAAAAGRGDLVCGRGPGRRACDAAAGRGGDPARAGQRDQVRDRPLRPHRARRHLAELVAGRRVEGRRPARGLPRWQRGSCPGVLLLLGGPGYLTGIRHDHDRASRWNRCRRTGARGCVVVDRGRAGPCRHRRRRLRGAPAVAAGAAPGGARALGAAGAGRPGAHSDRDLAEQARRFRCLVRRDRGRLPAEHAVPETDASWQCRWPP